MEDYRQVETRGVSLEMLMRRLTGIGILIALLLPVLQDVLHHAGI